MRISSNRTFWIGLVLGCVASGCGPDNPRGRVPVAGKITLDDRPLDHGNIVFVPEEADGIGTGAVIDDGAYRIEVLKGLPPGKYLVRIFSTGAPASGTPSIDPPTLPGNSPPPPPGVERVAPRYNVQSETVIEVTARGGGQFDFDVASK